MAKLANQNLVAYATQNGLWPTDGPKSLFIPLDFSVNTSYDIELEVALETGRLSQIQGVFIDNSKNAALTLTLVSGENQHRIVCPGGKQIYAPFFCGSGKMTATLSGAGSADTSITLLNFPVPVGQLG